MVGTRWEVGSGVSGITHTGGQGIVASSVLVGVQHVTYEKESHIKVNWGH